MENTERKVRITKLTDDVFNGVHPNGIDVGFVYEGIEYMGGPIVGNAYFVENFHTSRVTEILDNNTFKTQNSTYKLEYLD